MSSETTTQRNINRNTIKWLLGVALIGCATGLIADAFVIGESLWRPIAIGASGSGFFIGLRLWMSGIDRK
ncbi:MAG: hypothetical protein F4Y63_07325 [Chloroflexi bacterium]|nr:hypothetical protein [Chloroflexota bacterium]MYF79413.1 hypothetical protein [Chloroflexota bacterium]MYK62378.1 hypothetical protein [Chloroflexota bacterium]